MACNTSTAVGIGAFRRRYDLPVLGVIRPGAPAAALSTRNRRVGVIATPATIRSHAYFASIKDENPAIEVYEHATPTLVPMVEAGLLDGPGGGGDRRARRWRRSSASATPTASRSSRGRRARRSTRCSWAARTTRSCARSSRRPPGSGSPSSTRRRRPPRRWPSCSSSTASRRPARPGARPPTPACAGHERPDGGGRARRRIAS